MNEIKNLAHHVKSNLLIYDKIPIAEFEEEIEGIVKRLKMQKKLFIKEIANAIGRDISEIIPEHENDLIDYNSKAMDTLGDAISDHDAEGCISLLIEIEQLLHDTYSSFLFEEKPDEITRMILRNQSNEINRDIRILKGLYEYA